MKMGWRFVVVMAVLVLSLSALTAPGAANGDGWKKGWHGGKWDKDWDRWDRDRGFPLIIPARPYPVSYPVSYPVAYPAAYPVYVPANFGGNQGACFEACVNSGQYPPAQCGQMCYYA